MSFDEQYGTTLGVKTGNWHYGQMFLLSLTAVMAFESVGAIMVVGMLIVPAVTANIIFKSLKKVIWFSACFASSAVIIGWVISGRYNLTLSGTIVSITGIQLLVVILVLKFKRK